IRFGYALYASPFKDQSLMSDQQFFTGGFGYRTESFFADISYVRNVFNERHFLYNSSFNPTPSQNNITSGNIVGTIGFRF
ncbi:MAG: long-chain fatty acid transporter, partial [Bacteroidota bacterium]